MTELYKRYRPKTFKEVVGQDSAIRMLQGFLKKNDVPHAILLAGSSGSGKTTIARILKTKLGCGPSDFHELNCADFRGVEVIRDIRQRMGLAPISGECRVWLLDEAAAMTRDAQSAVLKMLEDTPKHVYFMLATTDPHKLMKTIITRCTEIKTRPLEPNEMTSVIANILDKEGKEVSEEVVERIVDVADGSARKALVILNQVLEIEDEEEQLNAVVRADSRRQAIELARLLVNPRSKWGDVAKVLKALEDEPESVRHPVLGYACSVLQGGGKLASRAYLIIESFSEPFYDTKRAGLAAACYRIICP